MTWWSIWSSQDDDWLFAGQCWSWIDDDNYDDGHDEDDDLLFLGSGQLSVDGIVVAPSTIPGSVTRELHIVIIFIFIQIVIIIIDFLSLIAIIILIIIIMIIVIVIQSVTFRFRNTSVSKLFHFFSGFGFGIEKIWYQKKYRIRYCKHLISKKVSDSVTEKFGLEKSFGFGFVQILGIVTHW